MKYHWVSWVWYWWEGAITALASNAVFWHPSLSALAWVAELEVMHTAGWRSLAPHPGWSSQNTSQLCSGLNWLLTAASRRKKKGNESYPYPPLSPATPTHLQNRTKKHFPAITVSYPIAGILVLPHENQCCWNTAFKQPHITTNPNV